MTQEHINNKPQTCTTPDLVYIEKDGQILFTVEEIGRCLGYRNPAHAIHKIFRGNKSELTQYSVGTKTVSTDGKCYETRAFTEEGVYIISMLARTSNAIQFRATVATLLKQIRGQHLTLAHQTGYQQGLSEARALPAAEADRKAAYLEGMKEGYRVQKRQDPLRMVRKAADYARKGLTMTEIALLTGCAPSTLRGRIRRAREAVAGLQLGMVQGALI